MQQANPADIQHIGFMVNQGDTAGCAKASSLQGLLVDFNHKGSAVVDTFYLMLLVQQFKRDAVCGQCADFICKAPCSLLDVVVFHSQVKIGFKHILLACLAQIGVGNEGVVIADYAFQHGQLNNGGCGGGVINRLHDSLSPAVVNLQLVADHQVAVGQFDMIFKLGIQAQVELVAFHQAVGVLGINAYQVAVGFGFKRGIYQRGKFCSAGYVEAYSHVGRSELADIELVHNVFVLLGIPRAAVLAAE